MITKHRPLGMSFALIITFVGLMAISSCAPGQFFGPTITPSPAPTQTPTATPTPDPVITAMADANELSRSGDSEGAISIYVSLLQQNTDATTLAAIFIELEHIGSQNSTQAELEEKDSAANGYMDRACETYKIARSAYEPLLRVQDRPAYEEFSFYSKSARVDAKLIHCHTYQDYPDIHYTEIISSALDNLDLYPDEIEIMDILVPAILRMWSDQLILGDVPDFQEILNNGQLIIGKVGNYRVNGATVEEKIHSNLLKFALCYGYQVPTISVSTSDEKKVYNCAAFSSNALEQAGILASNDNPGEIWYVLDMEYVEMQELKCTVIDSNTGNSYSYSYRGQVKEVYKLKNAQNGNVLASKTFLGTAPRCVFSTCYFYSGSPFANCTGGEGILNVDEGVLLQWITNNMN